MALGNMLGKKQKMVSKASEDKKKINLGLIFFTKITLQSFVSKIKCQYNGIVKEIYGGAK